MSIWEDMIIRITDKTTFCLQLPPLSQDLSPLLQNKQTTIICIYEGEYVLIKNENEF